jgi:hypothetical protein
MIDMINVGPYKVILLKLEDKKATVRAVFQPNPVQNQSKPCVIAEEKWWALKALSQQWDTVPLHVRVNVVRKHGFDPIVEFMHV